jgi:hypothetical protein
VSAWGNFDYPIASYDDVAALNYFVAPHCDEPGTVKHERALGNIYRDVERHVDLPEGSP